MEKDQFSSKDCGKRTHSSGEEEGSNQSSNSKLGTDIKSKYNLRPRKSQKVAEIDADVNEESDGKIFKYILLLIFNVEIWTIFKQGTLYRFTLYNVFTL